MNVVVVVVVTRNCCLMSKQHVVGEMGVRECCTKYEKMCKIIILFALVSMQLVQVDKIMLRS
jgi:hypothetical protein